MYSLFICRLKDLTKGGNIQRCTWQCNSERWKRLGGERGVVGVQWLLLIYYRNLTNEVSVRWGWAQGLTGVALAALVASLYTHTPPSISIPFSSLATSPSPSNLSSSPKFTYLIFLFIHNSPSHCFKNWFGLIKLRVRFSPKK